MHKAVKSGFDVGRALPYKDTNAEENVHLVFRIAK